MHYHLFKQLNYKKSSKEEELLIKALCNEARAPIKIALLKELGEEPSDDAVEKTLNILIKNLKAHGQFQQALNEYLKQKIEDERAHFRLSSKT